MAEKKNGSKKNTMNRATRQSISPLQRYRMIAETAYYRALERGFVERNPVEDWLEAEKDIDARYAVDFGKLLVTPHIAGLFDLLNRLFTRYGLSPIDIRSLMETERKNVEALAHANARVGEPIKTAVSRQIQILTDALEAMLTRFDLLAQVSGPGEPFAAEHSKLLRVLSERTLTNLRETMGSSMQASVESLDILKARVVESFGVLKILAEGFAEQSSPVSRQPLPATTELLNLDAILAPAFAAKSLQELTEGPVFALQGLSESDAQVLYNAFGIKTLKDFAESRHFNWATQILRMANMEVK